MYTPQTKNGQGYKQCPLSEIEMLAIAIIRINPFLDSRKIAIFFFIGNL